MSYSKGLEGVIAGETEISNVEGDLGRLTYRGYAIEELVEQDYLDVMWLILTGEMPESQERLDLRDFLDREGCLDEYEHMIIAALPAEIHPMKVLQAMVPVLDVSGLKINQSLNKLGPELVIGLKIIAKIPQLLVAIQARKSGSSLVSRAAKDSRQPYLKEFLHQFAGEKPTESHLKALNVIQILQMEHSFNAGTFSSMVVGSTLADAESAIAAGIGALSGSLHGGADQAALEAADKVGTIDKAEEFVRDLLKNKGRLMGMGHREYRVVDPRSVILKPLVKKLCKENEFTNTFRVLEAIEEHFSSAMKDKGKDVHANLEFYKGIAMLAIGIPRDFFTAVFAMSRATGWLAHFAELRKDNRIFRPRALYTGKEIRSLRQGAN